MALAEQGTDQPLGGARRRTLSADRPDSSALVLDATLALLAEGRNRLRSGDWASGLDHVRWAEDLLRQLIAAGADQAGGRLRIDRLSAAHRDLARAACEGDLDRLGDVIEFLAAIQEARHRRARPAATPARATAGSPAA